MPETMPTSRLPPDGTAGFADREMTISRKPCAARFILRGARDIATRGCRALGLEGPLAPMEARSAGGRVALWLGPDEWLLLALRSEQETLARELEAALAGAPHSLVDVSHRQVALLVSGRLAARALTSGCALDLSTLAFPVGMVARTLFHKAEIVLWRESQGFHLEVWRSFAPYVIGHLGTARRGTEGLTDKALP